jgi:P27 family predicted phage terminase small subunit
MARGRTPKPDNVRALEGYRDKKAMDLKTPDGPKLEDTTCPDYLQGYARECWQNLAPKLAKKGWITALDQPLFESFCQVYNEYRLAVEALSDESDRGVYDPKDGRTYWSYGRSGKMLRTRPQIAQMHEAIRQMKSLANEFGLSPAARTRLRGSDQGSFFDDLEEGLNG